MAKNAPTVFDVDEVVDFDDDFTETTESIYHRFYSAERGHLRQANKYGRMSHPNETYRGHWWRLWAPHQVAHIMDYHIQKAGEARAFYSFLENTGQLRFHYFNTDDGGPL